MAYDERAESGNAHAPGSRPAHFTAGSGGDRIHPGRQPDEVVPDRGDNYQPDRTPDEVSPNQGDFDQPDSAPVENPPPPETPAPPD